MLLIIDCGVVESRARVRGSTDSGKHPVVMVSRSHDVSVNHKFVVIINRKNCGIAHKLHTMRASQEVLLLVVSLSASFSLLQSTDTTAVISPDGTIQAALDPNTNTTFKCEVTEAGGLFWLVDETPAQDESIYRDRGITMTEVVTLRNAASRNERLQGSIIIPNSEINNQTTLICVAKNIIINLSEVNSTQVVLQLFAQDTTVDSVTDKDSMTSADDVTTKSSSRTTTVAVSSALVTFSITSATSTVMISIITLCMYVEQLSG